MRTSLNLELCNYCAQFKTPLTNNTKSRRGKCTKIESDSFLRQMYYYRKSFELTFKIDKAGES